MLVLLCWMINWYMFILLNQVPICSRRCSAVVVVDAPRFFFSEWLIWKIELISLVVSARWRCFCLISSRLKLSPKKENSRFFISARIKVHKSIPSSVQHINKTIKSNGFEAISSFVCSALRVEPSGAGFSLLLCNINDRLRAANFTSTKTQKKPEQCKSISLCVYLQMFNALIFMIYRSVWKWSNNNWSVSKYGSANVTLFAT